MNYLRWEIKKIWKKNYVFLFLLLTMILTSGYFIGGYEKNNPLNEGITQSFVSLSDYQFAEGTVDDNFTAEEQEIMTFLHHEIAQFETGSYDEADDRMIELYKEANRRVNEDNPPEWVFSFEHANYINPLIKDGEAWPYRIEENTQKLGLAQIGYLQKEKIEPRKPLRYPQSELDRQQTIERVEQLFGEEQEYGKISIDYHASRFDKGWYKLWQAIIDRVYLILIAIILFLFGGLLAIEKTGKNNHDRLLLSEGVTTRTIFFTKFNTSFFGGLLFLATSVVSILTTSLFFKGLGSLNYPVLFHFYRDTQVFPNDQASYFLHESYVNNQTGLGLNSISLGRYLLQSLILLIAVLLFLLAVSYLLATFIPNEPLIGLFGLGLIGSSLILPLSTYNPLSYFDIHKVVSGAIRLEFKNNQMSFESGLAVLLIWSLFFLLVTYVIQIKRQPKRIQRGSST